MLRIGLALCDALEHAHGRGVVHRDVKPQNVIVPDAPRSAAGVAKLADFGVAHLAGDEPLTRTGDVVGTLAYMAPEQAAGRRVDERADLYSLALVLYEALAGTNPVRAGSPAATARRVGTVLPAAQALAQGPAAGAVRRDRPRAAPAAGGARDARRARGRARGGAAGGLRRRRHRRAPPARAHRAAPAPARGRPRRRRARSPAACSRRRWPGPGSRWRPRSRRSLAVALLPRVGWLATAVAAIVVLALERPDAAVVAAAAALPVPLLLYRRGTAWSVPALAPLLGLATLAGAYPALAGRARGWFTRAALGALGAWWVLLYDVRDARPERGVEGASRAAHRRHAALRGRLGARRADPPLARPRPLARRRRRRGLGLGGRAGRRDGRGGRGDRRTGAARARARYLRRRPARGRATTPPSCWSGGAVTPGRILCTRNHGHHIPVAARERPAQP